MINLFNKKFLRVPHLNFSNAVQEIGRNAFVDWLIILIISVGTAIVLICGGLYLYWQISSGNFQVTEAKSETGQNIFNKKDFETVVARFQSREDMSEQIKRGYRGPADPSL